MKSNNFIVTLNNPQINVEDFVAVVKAKGFTYCRAQLERGESGTPHIQACFGGKATRFNVVAKMFPGIHVEAAKSPFDSWEYCGKEDTRVEGPYEFGIPPANRARKGDYAKLNKIALEQGPEELVKQNLISIGSYERIKKSVDLYKLHTADHKPIDRLTNEWHYGATGLGKSKKVREDNQDFYLKMPNKWWDGYAGQKTVIIDDFQKEHHVLGYHLKIWGDHYPFQAERKGATLQARPEKIVVTSNYHPKDIWEDPNVLEPILRRFKVIHY